MGRKDITVKSVIFSEEPVIVERTPYYYMSENDKISIEKFPFISINRVSFAINCVVRDIELNLSAVIPNGFCYNLADIPWLVEPISYDKHSPFVKNASYLHDYLISRKKVLYEHWELKKKNITPQDFRVITSLAFAYVLEYNGVPYTKAKLMAQCVDMWQTFLPSWKNLDRTEMAL